MLGCSEFSWFWWLVRSIRSRPWFNPLTALDYSFISLSLSPLSFLRSIFSPFPLFFTSSSSSFKFSPLLYLSFSLFLSLCSYCKDKYFPYFLSYLFSFLSFCFSLSFSFFLHLCLSPSIMIQYTILRQYNQLF